MSRRIATVTLAAAFGVSLIGSTALFAQGQSTAASRLAMAIEHDVKCGFAGHAACDAASVSRARSQAAARADLKCGFQPYAPCVPQNRRGQLTGGDFDIGQYMIELGRLEQRFERGELTLGQYIEASGQLQQRFER